MVWITSLGSIVILLAMAVAVSLLFIILVSNQKDRPNVWLAMFCGSTWFVSLFTILLLHPILTPEFDRNQIQIAMQLSLLAQITVLVAYLWTTQVLKEQWMPIFLLCISSLLRILIDPTATLVAEVATVILLVIIARKWIRLQFLSPVERMNQEIYEMNSLLQTTIFDLANEKDQIDRLNSELINANRFKSEFFSNMSHELRTPLNSVIGYSELLLSPIYGTLNPKQQDRLERIYKNGKHLASLIDVILDINKIDAGKLQIEVVNFQLDALGELLIKEFTPTAISKGITLQKQIETNLPSLNGDQQRIHQALHHLMANAIKFTNTGQVTLIIECKSAQDMKMLGIQPPKKVIDGEYLLTRIIDTGIGIPQEYLTRIFDEFAQVDKSNTREYEGIGLGLSISKRLIEIHEGQIWAESQVGNGSTFFVLLPAQKQTAL